MPYLFVILIGAALALILVRTGLVTTRRLISGAYAILGGVLGVMILRFVIGPMGPVGAIFGAAAGAVVLLYFATRQSNKPDE